MMRSALVSLCLALTSCSINAQQPRTISFYEDYVLARKISGKAVIAPPKGADYFGDIDIAITVGVDGSVLEAKYSNDSFSGLKKYAQPAIEAVKQWKFKPILYRGNPVIAQSVVSVDYRAQPKLAEAPEIDMSGFDYATFSISLQRSACFGSCPDYKVTVSGMGKIDFDPDPRSLNGVTGIHRAFSPNIGILVPLKSTDSINQAAIDRLVKGINKANFFGLKDSYEAAITDNPTYSVTVSMNGKTKTVIDYVGERAGMPVSVTQLEDLIDEVAGTSRWIAGTEGFFEGLKTSGFDFQSKEGAALAILIADSERASETDIIKMVEAGVPLNQTITIARMREEDSEPKKGLVGSALLSKSISSGKPKLAAYLIDRGWIKNTPTDMLNAAIADSGRQCDLRATELVISAGFSVNARNDEGKTGLLQLISGYPSCSDDLPKFLQTLQKWIALGADLNAEDDEGNTAIFGLEKLDALEILLANGADPKHKNKEGNSAAFSSWQDAIVLRLLEAGADTKGKYYNDKSLAERAKESKDMPATTAWLKEQHNKN